MKIWTSEHIFNHPWETVVQAAWRKYPNPMNPAVIGTDVVERKVEDGVLHTHRLVSSKWYFPKWAQSIFNIGTKQDYYYGGFRGELIGDCFPGLHRIDSCFADNMNQPVNQENHHQARLLPNAV